MSKTAVAGLLSDKSVERTDLEFRLPAVRRFLPCHRIGEAGGAVCSTFPRESGKQKSRLSAAQRKLGCRVAALLAMTKLGNRHVKASTAFDLDFLAKN